MLIEKNATGTTLQLTLDQKDDWIKYVELAADHDFYHTWQYHAMAANGEPVLFVYSEAGNFIAIPLLSRTIEGTIYKDLHCVYGYSGPISNLRFENVADNLKDNFLKAFHIFLHQGKFVSVFSKLHPFFNQNKLLKETDGLHRNGKTIAIDLQQSVEAQYKQYRQSTKESIKRCRRLGYTARESESQADIATFTNLYQSNMNRISAKDFYLFDEDYFTQLIRSTAFDCKLILVYLDNELACGSIIMCTNGIIQGHLIASNASHLKNSPAKFLIDEVSILGRKWGMKYYHLGGGLGFKEDSLLEWKLGFSNLALDYYSWRYIANEPVYNQLVEKSGFDNSDTPDFFPLYRMKP
ncbi:GNAT family N-acetyltransferase [Pedobacter sp. GSP4]|uniref:GNAT family N-acetyltransferase n=1 Tax=Pedobacter sp. GSP4 TaxID=3453716 RepID=UPI003EEE2814